MPRDAQAMLITVPVVGLLALINIFFTPASLFLYSWAGIVLIGVSIFFGVVRFSSRPKTWRGLLDHALAEYDPLNRTAYVELQTQIKEDGWGIDAFTKWAAGEAMALENHLNVPEQSQFLDRTLS
jgi:hypothetical protein